MRVSNWGMVLLAIYLILTGLAEFGLFSLGRTTGIIGVLAGVLLLMEHWRR